MHFCTQCHNMYYVSISATNKSQLVYYCRNCGHTDDTVSVSNVVVSSTQLKKSEQDFGHLINPYTKLDPTLPRVSDVLCPNETCPTNHGHEDEREIIYLRYDHIHMRYAYVCSTCDTVWKTEDNR